MSAVITMLTLIASLLVLSGPGTVSDRSMPDVRMVVDAHVVSAGDSIRVDVDVVAVLDGRNEAFALARTLGAAERPYVSGPGRIVGDTGVQSRPGDVVGGSSVYRFGRVFTIATTGPGTLEIGPVLFDWNESSVSSADAVVLVAEPFAPGFDPVLSVFPIRAESRLDDGAVTVRRNGTAFLAADHAVLTSYHVVMDAHRVTVRMPSGRHVDLDRGWLLDPRLDIALLYIDPEVIRDEGMRPLAMAGGDLSEHVTYSVGWRNGWLDRTVGVPLETDRSDGSRRWITSNPVRSGDSGGPLLAADGRVLGVITAGTVVEPRTEVLRREVCLAVDPRPMMDVLTEGRPPTSLTHLIAGETVHSDPFAVTLRAGAEFSIRRARRLPADPEWIDRLYRVIDAAETDGDARLLYTAGMTARVSGRDRMADRSFESALVARPGQPDVSYMLGLMHLQARSWTDAAARFEDAAGSPMYRHLALYGLARSLIGLHRFDEAKSLLQEVIAYDDRFAPALFDSGRIDISRGQDERAAIAVVRLAAIDGYWGRRLKRIIDQPMFAPSALAEHPRVPLPDGPWALSPADR